MVLEDDQEVNRGMDNLNGLEHQSSYVYQPSKKGGLQTERPSKRRKVSSSALPQKQDILPFAPLLEGDEAPECVKLRYDTFQELWANQEQEIQTILRDVDSGILASVCTFVEHTSAETCDGRIPAGLITLGSNLSSMGRLLDCLDGQIRSDGVGQVVALDSGHASNLKTVLKHIIRSATSGNGGVDGDQDLSTDRTGRKPLAYDLDILHEYVQEKNTQKLVIAFRDSEAFDHGLLTDLISLLSSWVDRIPFVLLFGIATSVELFEARLPRSVVNLLQGRRFDIQESGDSVERVFTSLQTNQESTVWLGHNVSRILFEKSKDHFQSPEGFGNGIKFRYVNDLLDDGEAKHARRLLEDDHFLAEDAMENLHSGQEKVYKMLQSVKSLATILQFLKIPKTPTLSELIIQALAGELLNSKAVEEMLAAIKKLPSDSAESLLDTLPSDISETDAFTELRQTLQSLIQNKKGPDPLRTEYDEHHSTHKTTVVRQRVKLTKNKAKLSKQDTEYTTFVDNLVVALQEYFSTLLIRPRDLFMHEAFLYDLKTPLRDAFTPRPRFTMERALSSPFDYLVSDAGSEAAPSTPAISTLYQLYLETGSLVNVYDLWRAYYTMAGGEDADEGDERQSLALFYRALSELKMMGMVKHSKKKVDHLAKSTWMGL
ncbi:hypothetical protein FQN53_008285 [Emmonsiellopsis sp. PD_33]|nr:hypothetical protein FQN53_008285 [Emmonsiellopsis sp. PD_33]